MKKVMSAQPCRGAIVLGNGGSQCDGPSYRTAITKGAFVAAEALD